MIILKLKMIYLNRRREDIDVAMKNMKCPNCAGQLYMDNKTKITQCPYCDTEIILNNVVVEHENITAKEQMLSGRLFSLKTAKRPNKEAIVSFMEACKMINENTAIADYLEKFESIAKTNENFAMENINKDLLQKVIMRIHSTMTVNEKILVYKDSGLFSKAKSGILITDENIYILEKRSIVCLALKDIYSISFGWVSSNCYLNNEDMAVQYSLDSIGCSNECLGMMIALICTMARDKNPAGYKIFITD